ncbi:MAG: radical SAM protein [bacterium]|jgi:uncharacterized protein
MNSHISNGNNAFARPFACGDFKPIHRAIRSAKYDAITIVDLYLTRRCNFRCDYCFVEEKNQVDASWNTINKALRFVLREAKNAPKVSFTLFGGEPLLCFDVIAELIPLAKRNYLREGKVAEFAVTTNASMATPEIMSFFRSYGTNLLLSIDGTRKSHDSHRKYPNGKGTFDSIAGKLLMMKYFQPWLGARVTPMPDTVENLRHEILELYAMGINQFIIGCATGVSWVNDEYDEYIIQMKALIKDYIKMRLRKAPIKLATLEGWSAIKGQDMTHAWGCSAGRSRISIDVDGTIQACAKVQGSCKGQGFLPFGNVQDGYSEAGLENRSVFYEFPIREREKCLGCEARCICLGGCPAINYVQTGSVHACPQSDCYLQHLYLGLRKYYLKEMEQAGLTLD